MSWQTDWDRLEQSPCACGEGTVIRREYSESDDWNRSQGGYYGETIKCGDCSKVYKIEYITEHYSVLPWKDDGVRHTAYLVPITMTLKHETREEHLYLKLDEQIVSAFKRERLEEIINDMTASKYSTRLKLSDSDRVVRMYESTHKKRALPAIINLLRDCVQNYDSYKWNFYRMQDHKEKERLRIAKSKELIEDSLSKSYKLKFQYVAEQNEKI